MLQVLPDLWVTRFASRLLELQPAINFDSAKEIGLATYANTSHMQPEDAAKIYAAELSSGNVEAPE